MTIGFTLNGANVSVEAALNERLIFILREKFNLKGAKSACHSGLCGSCAVFFNGVIAPSCLIPAFNLQGANVLTIEGFAQTAEYRDICAGFESAGVENCGYCSAGKILVAESLLRSKQQLEREDIMLAYDSVKCRCTDAESIVAGVFAAETLRKRRLNAGRA